MQNTTLKTIAKTGHKRYESKMLKGVINKTQ